MAQVKLKPLVIKRGDKEIRKIVWAFEQGPEPMRELISIASAKEETLGLGRGWKWVLGHQVPWKDYRDTLLSAGVPVVCNVELFPYRTITGQIDLDVKVSCNVPDEYREKVENPEGVAVAAEEYVRLYLRHILKELKRSRPKAWKALLEME